MARKAQASHAQRKAAALQARLRSADPAAEDAQRIAHAIYDTYDQLDKCKDPKGRALLARALRNLRETWHLVTGQARPGLAKPLPPRRPGQYAGASLRVLDMPATESGPGNGQAGGHDAGEGKVAQTPTPPSATRPG